MGSGSSRRTRRLCHPDLRWQALASHFGPPCHLGLSHAWRTACATTTRETRSARCSGSLLARLVLQRRPSWCTHYVMCLWEVPAAAPHPAAPVWQRTPSPHHSPTLPVPSVPAPYALYASYAPYALKPRQSLQQCRPLSSPAHSAQAPSPLPCPRLCNGARPAVCHVEPRIQLCATSASHAHHGHQPHCPQASATDGSAGAMGLKGTAMESSCTSSASTASSKPSATCARAG